MRLHVSKSQRYLGRFIARRHLLRLMLGSAFASVFGTPSIAADAAGLVEDIKGEAFADASN